MARIWMALGGRESGSPEEETVVVVVVGVGGVRRGGGQESFVYCLSSTARGTTDLVRLRGGLPSWTWCLGWADGLHLP